MFGGNTMNMKFIWTVLVLVVIVFANGCANNAVDDTTNTESEGDTEQETKDDEVIKVGAVLPMTGEGTPDQGQASQKGIMLAIDEINAQGGINGHQVEAVFEDSQCQAQKGVTGIRKLINVDKVDFVIGDICDSVTAAIMPIAEENEVVMITPGSTSPKISDAGDHIFRFWFSESDLGGLVAEEAYESDVRDMAILYINNAWGVAQKNGVKSRFEELGGEVVSEQAIDPDNVDYRTEILKAEENSPDAYYIGLHPNGLALAMRQLNEQGVDKQVYSHGGLVGSTQTLGLGGDDLEGIIAPFVKNPSETFTETFREEYDKEPGITADSAYDAARVVLEIMEEKNSTSSDAIIEGLYDVQGYDGASGEITVDENGDVHRPLQLMIVDGGELVSLNP